jgi:iron complex outermembrane receptor protein
LNFIRGAQWSEAFSYSRFRFRNYIAAGTDYSGNRLTGVPPQVLVSGLQLDFPENLSLFLQHNYTGNIPLNDANTVYAGPYNLLQAKVSWKPETGHKMKLEVYLWADNLLNESYSLGNDLNAVGSRYYNPAPLRNYTIGFNVTLPY